MVPFLHLFFFVLSSSSYALPACPGHCGNVSIPFPFGTQEGCSLPGFRITCNTSFSPPKPFVTTTSGDIEIASISIDGSTAVVLAPIASNCPVHSVGSHQQENIIIDVSNLPFALSPTGNKFTAVGCNTAALYTAEFLSSGDPKYASGCLSFCNNLDRVVNGTCSGVGCCQTAIPRGLQKIFTSVGSLLEFNSPATVACSYAFLVENESYRFSPSDIFEFSKSATPVLLDWAVANGTCAPGNHACGQNSICSDSPNAPGYQCSCNKGFTGNPYLAHGCQDINECEIPSSSPCSDICENTLGSFLCSCPRGYTGDGAKSGNGCTKESRRFPLVEVIVGSGIAILFFLVAGGYIYWIQKKRRFLGLKEKFFQKNGGILQQQLAAKDWLAETAGAARIFTGEELELATNNYSDSRVLGRGGNGTVYKGIFPDINRVVAIKKSRFVDGSQIDQFINEVVLLSQVVHKHVVRIHGCCLETHVPLLVYEYVPNGTLQYHLHSRHGSLSWEARLRIAGETAGALAYLHSSLARPIFHRDIKAANILLDENYMAKLSDFGASRLIPLDRAQITTLVQGTLGYLDPEYFQSGQLTEKSDVYSFGVVLAEILTGEKPISSERTAAEKNLGVYFMAKIRGGSLIEILEERVRKEGSVEQVVAIAEVARRCLMMNGEERPTMRDVAAELERARLMRPVNYKKGGKEETEGIFAGETGGDGESDSGFSGGSFMMENDSFILRMRNSSIGSAGSTGESLDERMMLSLEIQR